MLNKIVIASHGNFALGAKHAMEFIIGAQENIEIICAYTDESVDDYQVIEDIVKNHNYETSNLIVLTDVFGGSVNTHFMNLLHHYKFELIAGFNLTLLLELVYIDDEGYASLLDKIRKSERLIVYCNDLLEIKNTCENNF